MEYVLYLWLIPAASYGGPVAAFTYENQCQIAGQAIVNHYYEQGYTKVLAECREANERD